MVKKEILGLSSEKLIEYVVSIGLKKYRASQISEWFKNGIFNFDEMTNISKSDINTLVEAGAYVSGKIIDRKVSAIDGTEKYLFEFDNRAIAEGVLMNYTYGPSVCISTQAGCKMGCLFCASSKIPFTRNLTAGEMAYEVISMQATSGKRISHIVLMGIGEPLDNYDYVNEFLDYINNKDSLNIGMRNITLSTCGIVPKIRELAKLNRQITLSVSLHAPDNETRDRIMPINKVYPIEKLIEACDEYFNLTGRRISYEYSLIDGINDTVQHEINLAQLLKGKNCHVNLINLNNVKESELKPSKRAKEFHEGLLARGINATVRRKMGSDIDGACGQLRSDKYK